MRAQLICNAFMKSFMLRSDDSILEKFKQFLLSEIKNHHKNLLVLRECLLKFKGFGMDKNSMVRNLEELRNGSDTEMENILLELMDFLAGWCNPDLSIE